MTAENMIFVKMLIEIFDGNRQPSNFNRHHGFAGQ